MAATSTAIAVGTAQLVSADRQASALRAQGRFSRQQAEFNARQAEKQALEIRKLGQKRAAENDEQVRKLVGEQRAVLAAQGIVVDDGVALSIQNQTKEIGLEDSLTIRNNAMRQAFGLEQQAFNIRTQGIFTEAGSRVAAANTLVAGSVRALGTFGQAALREVASRTDAPLTSQQLSDSIRSADRTPVSSFFDARRRSV